MEYQSGETTAVLKFFNEEKMFGFAPSPLGDLHISGEVMASYRHESGDKNPLREGDFMRVTYFTDQKGRSVTKILSVEREELCIEAVIVSSNIKKRYYCLESGEFGELCLPFSLVGKRSVSLKTGDVLRVYCDRNEKSLVVTSFDLMVKKEAKALEMA